MHTLVLLLVLSFVALPGLARGQGAAPAREPAEMTPAHEALIKEGMSLHDQGAFEEAMARYRQVLTESPTNVIAMFELSYAQLSHEDYDQALETAKQGIAFKSMLLPMFYDMMASALEGKGQPQQAIDVYRQGIAVVPDAPLLYHNMAVTYRERLHDGEGARQALKKAAALAPSHPGIHLFLGKEFQSAGYSTPALLALSTYLTFEPYGPQALDVYTLWRALLREPVQAANAAEGDFSATDRYVVVSNRAMRAKMDEGATEADALVVQVDALLGTLRRDAAPGAASFTATHYVPFFAALREQGYVETFVYWASQRGPVPGVKEWLGAHQDRVRAFVEWATNYSWPEPRP